MALRVFFILYCIEAGVFFLLAPWTRFWLGHPLLTYNSSVAALTVNPFLRGFISGFGVVHLLIGFREILLMVSQWRER